MGPRSIARGILGALLAPLPLPQHPTLRSPGLHLRWRMGWIKGWLWRPWWTVLAALGGVRIQIGKRFSLMGSLTARGAGTLVIGDDVIFDAHATPYVHSRNALLSIGDRSYINGTRFGVSELVEIGADAILADARITDSDYHLTHAARAAPGQTAPVAPVHIEDNVWIAAGAAVLKGVRIGRDSVVAFGAVVVKDIPSGRIVGGNPARDLGPIPETPTHLRDFLASGKRQK